ncbi:MAG: GNAT family N-acetyltransferase [Micropruina sp.]|nr:MAG: GNAT family N-acetyltransferase [Micropruina sp.]
MEIVRREFGHPDAIAMCAAVQAEYRVLYGGGDAAPMDAADFAEPDGAFFVGYVAGRPVASGSWRRIVPGRVAFSVPTAEIKRMYVTDDQRRRGLGRAMLFHVEDDAAAHGLARVVLETGSKQPAAIALYRALGYTDTDGTGWAQYAGYPGVVILGRDLTPR